MSTVHGHIYNSELTKLLFQDDSKMTQADAAVEAVQRTSLVNGKLRDQLVMFGFSLWLFEINTTLNKPSGIC